MASKGFPHAKFVILLFPELFMSTLRILLQVVDPPVLHRFSSEVLPNGFKGVSHAILL
jgi:hypothetical protein